MTTSEPEVADRPFPGAHSQVPRARVEPADTQTRPSAAQRALPLEGVCNRLDRGWVIRLPVRAERVTVSKDVVVVERDVLRRGVAGDVERVQAVVKREQLRVEKEGHVGSVGPAENVTGVQVDEHLAAPHGLPWRRDARDPSAD